MMHCNGALRNIPTSITRNVTLQNTNGGGVMSKIPCKHLWVSSPLATAPHNPDSPII